MPKAFCNNVQMFSQVGKEWLHHRRGKKGELCCSVFVFGQNTLEKMQERFGPRLRSKRAADVPFMLSVPVRSCFSLSLWRSGIAKADRA